MVAQRIRGTKSRGRGDCSIGISVASSRLRACARRSWTPIRLATCPSLPRTADEGPPLIRALAASWSSEIQSRCCRASRELPRVDRPPSAPAGMNELVRLRMRRNHHSACHAIGDSVPKSRARCACTGRARGAARRSQDVAVIHVTHSIDAQPGYRRARISASAQCAVTRRSSSSPAAPHEHAWQIERSGRRAHGAAKRIEQCSGGLASTSPPGTISSRPGAGSAIAIGEHPHATARRADSGRSAQTTTRYHQGPCGQPEDLEGMRAERVHSVIGNTATSCCALGAVSFSLDVVWHDLHYSCIRATGQSRPDASSEETTICHPIQSEFL